MDKLKEHDAIQRLKAFEPDEGYWVAYSGGKDSDCIRILCELAGVKYEIHHNLTSVDAPETVNYIKSIPNVHIDKARFIDGTPKTMWNLIPLKRVPPTRLARWCCSELKEGGGSSRLVVTGVRWAESYARSKNAAIIRCFGKQGHTIRFLKEYGLNFQISKQGGILLNPSTGDNDSLRSDIDFVHRCYRDRKITLNPIVDWSDLDVWNFLNYYGCFSNPLYYEGCSRIGCIGCPLSGPKNMKKDFSRYPKYKDNYIRSFQKMVDLRLAEGLYINDKWRDGNSVFQWWIGEDCDQLSFFTDDELVSILQGMGG